MGMETVETRFGHRVDFDAGLFGGARRPARQEFSAASS